MRRTLIPIRIFDQIELMVVLCIIPLPSIYDLRDDLRTLFLLLFKFRLTDRDHSPLTKLCLLLLIVWDMGCHRCFDRLGRFALSWRINEYGGAVLGTSVVSLAVRESWVMCLEEKFCNMVK